MRRNSFPAIVLSLLAIVLCGGLGALAGFALVRILGLSGTLGALAAVVAGMVVATLAYGLGVALLRKLGAFK
jgi:hypothetical protein